MNYATPFGSAQANYDAALPPDDSKFEAAVEKRAGQLKREYRQDLAIIHDALGDLSCRPMAKMLDILMLVRDGNDDAELGRLVRLAVLEEVDVCAEVEAEKELQS